jgi:four helix bundle protein
MISDGESVMGEAIRTHKDLEVWKEAMQLARDVYTWRQNLPREEIYGLVAQIRRAAISIPSNIAEGAARGSRREFRQFLYVALGSLAELETQIFLAKELFGLDDGGLLAQVEKQRRLLLGLIRSLGLAKEGSHG